MKGSKRHRWLKDGIKDSKKHYKHRWDKQLRNRYDNEALNNGAYRKIAGKAIYDYVP